MPQLFSIENCLAARKISVPYRADPRPFEARCPITHEKQVPVVSCHIMRETHDGGASGLTMTQCMADTSCDYTLRITSAPPGRAAGISCSSKCPLEGFAPLPKTEGDSYPSKCDRVASCPKWTIHPSRFTISSVRSSNISVNYSCSSLTTSCGDTCAMTITVDQRGRFFHA